MCDRRRHPSRRQALPALVAGVALFAPATGLAVDPALSDPFRPPGWGESAAPADDFDAGRWRLESTLTSNGRRVAIINGRAVSPGDRVGGARVLGIEPGAARLDYEGREFTVRRPTTRVRSR